MQTVSGGLQRYAQAVAEHRWASKYESFSNVIDNLKNQLETGGNTLLLAYSRDNFDASSKEQDDSDSDVERKEEEDEDDGNYGDESSRLDVNSAFRYKVDFSQADGNDAHANGNSRGTGGKDSSRSNAVHNVYNAVVTNNSAAKLKCVVVNENVLATKHSDGDRYRQMLERMFIMHSKLRNLNAVAKIYPRALS